MGIWRIQGLIQDKSSYPGIRHRLLDGLLCNTATISFLRIISKHGLASKLGIDTHNLKGICNGGERDQSDPDGWKKSHEDWRALRAWEIWVAFGSWRMRWQGRMCLRNFNLHSQIEKLFPSPYIDSSAFTRLSEPRPSMYQLLCGLIWYFWMSNGMIHSHIGHLTATRCRQAVSCPSRDMIP